MHGTIQARDSTSTAGRGKGIVIPLFDRGVITFDILRDAFVTLRA
jgi:hypothetical protein